MILFHICRRIHDHQFLLRYSNIVLLWLPLVHFIRVSRDVRLHVPKEIM